MILSTNSMAHDVTIFFFFFHISTSQNFTFYVQLDCKSWKDAAEMAGVPGECT